MNTCQNLEVGVPTKLTDCLLPPVRGTCDISQQIAFFCIWVDKYEGRLSLVWGKYKNWRSSRYIVFTFWYVLKYSKGHVSDAGIIFQRCRTGTFSDSVTLIPESPWHWYACNDVSWAQPTCSFILNTLWLHCLICSYVILRYLRYIYYIGLYVIVIFSEPYYFHRLYSPIFLYHLPMSSHVTILDEIHACTWMHAFCLCLNMRLFKQTFAVFIFILYFTRTPINAHSTWEGNPKNTNRRGQKRYHIYINAP